jgi:hypothetical protein
MRRIALSALALSCCLALVGCSDDSSEDDGGGGEGGDAFIPEPVECQTSIDCELNQGAVSGECMAWLCSAGECSEVPKPVGTVCQDGSPSECVHYACDAAGACVEEAAYDGFPCGLNDGCSFDQCLDGACETTNKDCDDANPCTADTCEMGLCEHAPMGGDCDDGDVCTIDDACSGGICTGEPSPECECISPADCPPLEGKCQGAYSCVDSKCVIDPASIVDCTAVAGPCAAGECIPETGECRILPLEDGTACEIEGELCPGMCSEGACGSSGAPATEVDCDDGADEDCDGAMDCDDEDCAADPACAPPAEDCDNGADDDGDLDVDCDDADCAAAPNCQPAVEDCDNGTDDDGDDDVDCDDSDCAAAPNCQPPVEDCDNGTDDDGDDDIDCADAQCADDAACKNSGAGCPIVAEVIDCAQTLEYDFAVETPSDAYNSHTPCSPLSYTGPEAAFKVASLGALATLQLSVSGTSHHIFVYGDGGTCGAGECLAGGTGMVSWDEDGSSPDNYYVIVEGIGGVTADFSITLQCALP